LNTSSHPTTAQPAAKSPQHTKLIPSHYLMTCRVDNWIRLLHENHWQIARDKWGQFFYMFLTALALTPFTLLEKLLYTLPVRGHRLKKDPVFIIGHWRSGTTYLQNLMSRDPQFAWFDPLNTALFNNSLVLGKICAPIVRHSLRGARPMDNVKYAMDLPMEDVFALNLISPHSIIHLLAFPKNYQFYISKAFIDEQPPLARNSWERAMEYVVRKVSYRKKNKQLLMKSPDHTCHIPALRNLFPRAKYINIHRNPYVTIMSTIHMFIKQTELLRLTDWPEGDLEELLEDAITDLFARMYQKLFAMQQNGDFDEGTFVEIAYEELEADPIRCLSRIYTTLGIPNYGEALPHFQAYVDGQKNYVKNKFQISPRLRDKINDKLGFYFEHYGYPMITE